jgi:signal transduction histidine kinase
MMNFCKRLTCFFEQIRKKNTNANQPMCLILLSLQALLGGAVLIEKLAFQSAAPILLGLSVIINVFNSLIFGQKGGAQFCITSSLLSALFLISQYDNLSTVVLGFFVLALLSWGFSWAWHWKSKEQNQRLNELLHELKTPLICISGYSKHLLEQSHHSEYENSISIIDKNCDYILSLTSYLIGESMTRSKNCKISDHAFFLEEFCLQVEKLFSQQCSQKNINLKFTIGKEVPRFVLGEQIKLRQILINLIGNAIKYSNSKVVLVHLEFDVSNQAFLWKVQDFGDGISRMALLNIFSPTYYCMSKGQSILEGSGLGLKITRKLIKELGGQLEVKSAEREGVEICFSLPYDSFQSVKSGGHTGSSFWGENPNDEIISLA